jgi:hypothetical protein
MREPALRVLVVILWVLLMLALTKALGLQVWG